MKLLIYSEYFLPVPGGVQTVVLELARGIALRKAQDAGSDGIAVTVVTRTKETMEEDSRWPFRLVRNPGLRGLARLMREADVVHLAGPAMIPLMLGLLLQKPLVVEHHGFHVACPNGLMFYEPEQMPCPQHFMAGDYRKCFQCNQRETGDLKSLREIAVTKVRRWLSNRAFANVNPTDWLGTMLRLERMRTIYHGIAPSPAAAQLNATLVSFAFQGRLVSTKGVAVLLRAAERLRDDGYQFQVKIIGGGPEDAALKHQASVLDGRVSFLGHVPDEKLADAVSDAAAVVMPSLGGEVFGLVAAENMLRGKLVIASDIGALKEVIGDTGMIFPAGDAEALADCLRQVIERPELASALGQAARRRAMRVFSRDVMIDRHLAVYREAVAR